MGAGEIVEVLLTFQFSKAIQLQTLLEIYSFFLCVTIVFSAWQPLSCHTTLLKVNHTSYTFFRWKNL